MEVRQCLPDDAGKGNRRVADGKGQIVNFQLLVFAKVADGWTGVFSVRVVVFITAAGCGLFMAGTGKQENLLMARAHGNHPRPADDDEQKGEKHDAVAQCLCHGMGRIVKRLPGLVKSKVADVGGARVLFFRSCGECNVNECMGVRQAFAVVELVRLEFRSLS